MNEVSICINVATAGIVEVEMAWIPSLPSKTEGNTNWKPSLFKTKLKANITEQKLKELQVGMQLTI